MSNRVACIIGFGEFGRQIFQRINEVKYEKFYFFDDNQFEQNLDGAKPFNDFLNLEYEQADFFVALGYRHLELKQKILVQLYECKRHTPSIIDQSVLVSGSAQLSAPVVIYPLSNIDLNVFIDFGTVVNNSVVVSHDSQIGSCCYISPGVIISGNVKIGDRTFIGSGTIISNNVTIGSNVKIGVGSVVTKDIPDNVSVIGNPARILRSSLNL